MCSRQFRLRREFNRRSTGCADANRRRLRLPARPWLLLTVMGVLLLVVVFSQSALAQTGAFVNHLQDVSITTPDGGSCTLMDSHEPWWIWKWDGQKCTMSELNPYDGMPKGMRFGRTSAFPSSFTVDGDVILQIGEEPPPVLTVPLIPVLPTLVIVDLEPHNDDNPDYPVTNTLVNDGILIIYGTLRVEGQLINNGIIYNRGFLENEGLIENNGRIFTSGVFTNNGTVHNPCPAQIIYERATPAGFETVTVTEECGPTFSPLSDILVEISNPDGQLVSYPLPGASDASGPAAVTCDPPSPVNLSFNCGDIQSFACAQKMPISCTAIDSTGNVSYGGFYVIATDAVKPTFSQPLPDVTAPVSCGFIITWSDQRCLGAVVSFNVAQYAQDNNGIETVTCDHASGVAYPVGETLVTCVAIDKAGNPSDPSSFTIAVVDSTPPILGSPSECPFSAGCVHTTFQATDSTGVTIEFAPPAWDATDGFLPASAVSCTGGNHFPFGDTQITCTATDQAGNVATSAYTIHVTNGPPTVTITGPATVNAGEDGSFLWTASDPDGNDLGGDVITLVDGDCGAAGTNPDVFVTNVVNGSHVGGNVECTFPTGPATSTVSVVLRNDRGEGRGEFNVTVNAAPEVTLTGPTTVIEGEDGSFTWTASDPEGDAITLVGGDCGAAGTNPDVFVTNVVNGSHMGGNVECTFPAGPATSTVSVVLRDSQGAEGRAELDVTVNPAPDDDADGVDNAIEDGAPNGGDGNGDGTPDSEQAHVTSLPNAVDGAYITLAAPEGASLVAVEATAAPSPSELPDITFPAGLVGFTLEGLTPGSAVEVTILLANQPFVNDYYKYGPTPDNPDSDWYSFLFDGTTGADLRSDRIVLHLVDGGRGDSDRTADGTIVDPGGGAHVPNEAPVCAAAAPSQASLWPVNHKFVSVDVLGVSDPDGDAVTLHIDGIFQDEAVDAPDSGNTAPDGQIVDGDTVEIRAERVGGGNGRVYHITFAADDGHGGTCAGEVLVGVPLSKNDTAVDDGALFDSTGGVSAASVSQPAQPAPTQLDGIFLPLVRR